ncbi:hydrogenase nickel incorporation protein HybF [Pasteurellaceae bacterium Pebbles2]|nr:hydrogenase nickel incorporation protein HybF [Pasteurellaceae bacterium Pebbles2]
MHELSLTQHIIDIVEQQCRENNVQKVTDLWLEIGALSCVEPEAIQFCFDVSCQDTPLQDCRLHFIPVPAQAYCWQCEKTVQIQTHQSCCPDCGSTHLQRRGGDELRIKQIEVI